MTADDVGVAVLGPEQIVEAGLAASRTDGCAVVVTSSSEANLRWAGNTVTTNGSVRSLSFYVVAFVGESAASVFGAASDAVSKDAVAAVVRAAESAARAASESGPARDAMPLWRDESGGGVDDDFGQGAARTSFDVFSSLVDGLAAAFDDARSGERLLYGFARHELATVHLGTSTGVRRRWVQPTGTLELNAKSADLSGSVWAGQPTADFTDVDVLATSESLTERLGWAKRRIDLPAGRYDTVLPPSSVADFMIYLAWSASARPAFEGRSAFSAPGGTRVGERLTDRDLVLFGDPGEFGMEYAPFVAAPLSTDDVSVFDIGAPAGRLEVIRDGAIGDLVHTRSSAAEYGAAFTPEADNLTLAGGDQRRTTADLIRSVERGLLVTSLWYIREVDPMTMLLTGLTRDGVFLVENGEVTGAVNNFRFNMSPFDVLRRGADIGRTERCLSREWSDWFTRTAMPPITVEGFHMSSVSQAQ